jgi:hypothetical protein
MLILRPGLLEGLSGDIVYLVRIGSGGPTLHEGGFHAVLSRQ